MKLTSKQFKKLSDLVYHASGINLRDGKEQLLTARLSKRLRKTGIQSVEDYLKVLDTDIREFTHFMDAVSTNHTFFFRESHHFDCLQSDHARIWCAASSSGEEPYSVAIHCLEKGHSPTILATDISTQVLDTGVRGVYPKERAKNVAMPILRKYFQKGQGRWKDFIKVKDQVRRLVTFKQLNLLTDPLPSVKFDVIFCRNVLIYFDNVVKTKVIDKLHQALKQNGYFIIGGAESLNNIPHRYKYLKPSIYRKV
jgi:chemotaxis protein methyltransferase CheR